MNWSKWFKKPVLRTQAPVPRRRAVRLGMETLEERTTPTVNTSLISVALPTFAGSAASITSASAGATFSADENLVVFSSDASNLIAGDANGFTDIFVANLSAGTVTRVSIGSGVEEANGASFFPSISADGRYVAFQSSASNLVANDGNGTADIFVKDLQTGTIALASSSSAGTVSDNFSSLPAISANGQYVVFSSFASNLAAEDTDSFVDIFRKNLSSGQIDLVSKTSAGVKGNLDSTSAAISADGRFIAFATDADNLLPANADNNNATDIYRKDMSDGSLTLVSANAAGTIGGAESSSPSISADGNIVAFVSASLNLAAVDGNGADDVFIKNLTTQAVERVSVSDLGSELAGLSNSPSISDDGTLISFVTQDETAVAGDGNFTFDVFVRNTTLGTTTRVSTRANGAESASGGDGGRLSPSGAKVAFFTTSDDLDPLDNNGASDVYVKTIAGGAVTLLSRGSLANIGGSADSFLNVGTPQLSADGQSVVFVSAASNLVSGTDANTLFRDVYLRNLTLNTTTRISTSDLGIQGNGDSASVAINSTGATSLIAFSSTSTNLNPADEFTFEQVYLKNPATGAIAPLSVTTAGGFGDGDSYAPVFSGNGQFVAFITYASNLFADGTPNDADIVVLDLTTGAIALVSATTAGVQIGGNIQGFSISDDGRYVAFASDANGLVAGDDNNKQDVFVKYLSTGTLTLVSKDGSGVIGGNDSFDPVISGDGRYVAFTSATTTFVAGDDNNAADVFRSDWAAGANGDIVRVSTQANGEQINGQSGNASIGHDGRFVAFASVASNLANGDANGVADVFVKDVQTGAVYVASQSSAGLLGNNESLAPSLSLDGRTVAYTSLANNLTNNDFNAFRDVFVTNLNRAPVAAITGATSIAEGQPLALDATGTTDGEGDTLSFAWDLNDDGDFSDAIGATFALSAAELDALGLGDGTITYQAHVRVTDAFGPVIHDFNLTITNVAPTPILTPGTIGTLEGTTASFTGSATDPSSADVVAGITLQWAVTRNGVALTTGSGPSFTFNLDDNGSYDVRLRAVDQDNGQNDTFFSFDIANVVPTITTLNAPAMGFEGSPISFVPIVSDPGVPDLATGFAFSWSVTKDGVPYVDGVGAAVTFTPDDNASYVISVTARDKDLGSSLTESATISVANVAPNLNIASDATVTEGATYTLPLSASDPGTDTISSWVITWGDGSTPETLPGTATSASHVYANGPASFALTVVAEDEDGTFTATQNVTVADVAPSVTLGGAATAILNSTYDLLLGDLVDPGQELVTGLVIDWGDSTSDPLPVNGFGQTYQHTYTSSGSFTIRVNVTNNEATFEAGHKDISVAAAVPTIAISGPSDSAEGATYTLLLGAIDNPSAQTITGYSIAWGDGETTAGVGLPPASATHVYADGPTAKIITVSLLSGDTTYDNPATLSVAVNDVAPVVGLMGSATVNEGSLFALKFGLVTDPGSDTVASYSVAWGDGTTDGAVGNLPTGLPHVYQDGPANYTIEVTLTDEDGPHLAGTFATLVQNVAPNFNAGADAFADINTAFSRSGAFVDPGADIWTATVDYGDGLGAQPLALVGKTYALSHTYTVLGAHLVTVRIDDGDGGIVADSFAVTVVSSGTPTFEAGQDATLNEGATLTRAGSFDDSTGTSWTATVDYGDGLGAAPLPLVGQTFSLSHTYVQQGAFTVVITITNNNNAALTDSFVVTAANVAPAFDAGASLSLSEGGTLSRSGAFTDPGADAWTATVDYGDGLGAQSLALVGKTYALDHTYAQQGSFTVAITIDDGDGGSHTDSFVVTVANVAPAFDAGVDAFIQTGGALNRPGTFTDPGNDTWTATVDYGDGLGAQPLALVGKSYTLSHTHPLQGTFTVIVTIADGDGGSLSDSFAVTVLDTAPAFDAGPDTALNEGDTLSRSGLFVDFAGTSWTATVDYGDGAGEQALPLVGQTYTLSHIYPQQGTFAVTVKITNNNSDVLSDTFVVTAANVAPAFDAGADVALLEGGALSRTGSFTDPGADTWTATVNYGDGQGVQTLALVGKSYTLSHVYLQDGAFTVTVAIGDGTITVPHTFTVTVANVLPTVSAGDDVNLPSATAFIGAGTFADPRDDTWTATVNYGDNTGDQTLALVGKTFTLNHTYAQKGTFTVTVTVNDGTGSSSDTLIVTIPNIAPAITMPANTSLDEGATFSGAGSFTDSDADTWTATVDYGLGAGPETLTLVNKVFNLAKIYPNNGTFTVTVTVNDGTITSTSTTTVTVANVVPTVSAGANVSLANGQTFTRSGSFTDPGADAWTATVDYGDGTGVIALTLTPTKTFELSHVYTQVGTFPVTVSINDGTGAGTATFNVTVTDVTLTLSANTVVENSLGGTVVGAVSTSDAALDAAGTFSLVDNAGNRFAMNGRNLVVAAGASLDFETTTSHLVRVRVVANGQTFEKDFTVQVLDGDEGDDFVGRDPITGELYVAKSTGSRFVTTNYQGVFNPAKTWVDVFAADFDGDGFDDVIARDQASGEVWLARNAGTTFVLGLWETWHNKVTWADTKFIDLNGDGKVDVLSRDLGAGDWWASFSQGTTGRAEKIGTWDTAKSWVDVQTADLNKDGRIDIIGRLAGTGQLFASLNRANTTILGGAKYDNQNGAWTTLSDGNQPGKTVWLDAQVADVNGDGKLDYLGRVQRTGHWYVNLGTNGKAGASQFWTAWNPKAQWASTSVADLNGDGKADLIGHTLDGGEWWVGVSPATAGGQVSNQKWGAASGFFYTDVFIGDFNRDGKTDVAGIRAGTGQWSVGLSTGVDFSFSIWDAWPTDPARLTVRRGRIAN